MSKILINERQLAVLVEYIGTNRNELRIDESLIKEGFKEVVLAIAMLIGANLSGQNKATAQSALANANILNQVKTVLQDERLETVVDSLESSGMVNAMEKIQKNADKIEKKFNEKATRVKGIKGGLRIYHGKEVVKKSANNYKKLATKLKSGYALTDISIDTVQQLVRDTVQGQPVIDSFQVVVDAGEFMNEGKYVLSDAGRASIKDILDQIKEQDGVVIGIRIESSTDKQRISNDLNDKLVSIGYPSGNEGLSKVRNDQIKKEFINLGVDSSHIKQDYKWDEGKGELNAPVPQDPTARYVKFYIDAIKISDDAPEDTVVETTEDVLIYNFELAKVREKQFDLAIRLPKNVKKGKTKKGKCGTSCPTFGKDGIGSGF